MTELTETELRYFLGLASYYSCYLKNFASVAPPLHALLDGGGKKRKSGVTCQNSQSVVHFVVEATFTELKG